MTASTAPRCETSTTVPADTDSPQGEGATRSDRADRVRLADKSLPLFVCVSTPPTTLRSSPGPGPKWATVNASADTSPPAGHAVQPGRTLPPGRMAR
ncbi:hypothetical protein SALBM311S_02086 [Streptomyces alboniger]